MQTNWQFFGASVRGPGHIRQGLPNQDAWIGKKYAFGNLIAVSDGIGSHPHSDVGSKAACMAVAEAVKLWSKTPKAPVEFLLKLIHHIWNLKIFPHQKDVCGATCLFAVVLNKGPLILAQLGDGLVFLSKNGEAVTLPKERKTEFTNETTALGAVSSLREWRYNIEPQPPQEASILLATDGVSEDILPKKQDEFCQYIKNQYAPLEAVIRWRKLSKDLRNWPTPRHTDDKTVSFMWKIQ